MATNCTESEEDAAKLFTNSKKLLGTKKVSSMASLPPR